ncbi:MAG: hypothetical protein HW390_3448 [Candidatus Brocadiaceae bacterium]|nr:hypothetical protein [Candidatus Brocadiaceae bacterium]
MVLFFVPGAIFFWPIFLYVIIVLCLGKMMQLFSVAYYFQYKDFLHGKQIPRRSIARFYTQTVMRYQTLITRKYLLLFKGLPGKEG